MKQLFLSDVDGTLLANRQPLPAKVVQAALHYQQQGGALALCSGRSVKALRPVVKTLGITLPCIAYGGTAIYDYGREAYLWCHPFSTDALPEIRQTLLHYPDIALQVFTKDGIYTLQSNTLLQQRGILLEQQDNLACVTEIRGPLLKILLVSEDPARMRQCLASRFCDKDFTVEAASTHFTEITPGGVNKGSAVQVYRKLLQMEEACVCAAGDGKTDLSLLLQAQLRFAPENAKPEVKEICHHVVPAAENGGMADAFSIALSS